MAGNYNSAESDLFTAIYAIFAADSGSGGLANSSANAYLRGGMFDSDDPHFNRENTNWPFVIVDIDTTNYDQFGKAGYTAEIKFECHFDRDTMSTTTVKNAVMGRLYMQYHRVAPSQSTNWQFSPIVFRRDFDGPGDGKDRSRIIQASCPIINRSGV